MSQESGRNENKARNMFRQVKDGDGSTIRIMIVDDHPVVREGLRAAFDREVGFEICGDVGTASEALALIESQTPHLVSVDILLKDENGIDLIRSIKSLKRNIRILACSMYDEWLYAERALAAGAMGYINKGAGIRKIVEAIRMVMAGEIVLSERMRQHILGRNIDSRSNRQDSLIETLSNRELEIFRMIGHGMTTSQIGDRMQLSAKTIDSYSQNIRRRLHLENAQLLVREAVQWVLENG